MDEVITELGMAFGKLPGSPELKAMTMRRVRATYGAWERRPPPHRAIATLLQAQTTWKPKETEVPGEFRESTREELATFAGGAGLRTVGR